METFVINIGLKTNSDKAEISNFIAVNAVINSFGLERKISFKTEDSNYNGETEKTLIVGLFDDIKLEDLEIILKNLCSMLVQDCISYLDVKTNFGSLVWNTQVEPFLSFDKKYMKF